MKKQKLVFCSYTKTITSSNAISASAVTHQCIGHTLHLIIPKHIRYSLKFSRLKIFMDFVGQSKARKIFSREMLSSLLMLGVAGSSTAKILSMKL